MLNSEDIKEQYFWYLLGVVDQVRPFAHESITFHKLCRKLHSIPFEYTLMMDENRACDGIGMRYRFTLFGGYYDNEKLEVYDILAGPCSFLEMLVGLALRIEENIMTNPYYGDRTDQWFYHMLLSLRLHHMINARFDEDFVDECIEKFNNREFDPEGRGSLFWIKRSNRDLNDVEIWIQAMQYLNTLPE